MAQKCSDPSHPDKIIEPAGSRASATAARYVGAMAAVTGPASATPGEAEVTEVTGVTDLFPNTPRWPR